MRLIAQYVVKAQPSPLNWSGKLLRLPSVHLFFSGKFFSGFSTSFLLSPAVDICCVKGNQLTVTAQICSASLCKVSQGAAHQLHHWAAWWKAPVSDCPATLYPENVNKTTRSPSLLSVFSFGTLCILSHLELNDRNNLFFPLRRIAWHRKLTWSLLSEEGTSWWKGNIWKIFRAFFNSCFLFLVLYISKLWHEFWNVCHALMN